MAKYILLTLSTLLLVAGCDNRLDLDPIGSVTEENFYKTAEDADAAVIACYNSMLNIVGRDKANSIDNRLSGAETWGDLWSSDVEPHPDIVDWQQIQQYTLAPTNFDIERLWTLIYEGIFRANIALEKIPQIEMDAGLKSRLMKEATFIRGFWIFRLAKLFGDAPLVTKVLTLDELHVPKSTQLQLFSQAEQDFVEAEALPDEYGDQDVGRATSYAAKAFLAELYMWEKRWPEAKTCLSYIIDSDRFGLIDSYSELFDGTTENTVESVFEIQYKANTGRRIGNFSTTYSAPNGEGFVPGGGWGWVRPTQDLVNEYEVSPKEDPRLGMSIFRLGDEFEGKIFNDVVNGTGYSIKKWTISGNSGVEIEQVFPWHTSNNFALFRYAEILLMYAEVLNELDDQSAAIDYVNMVRKRPTVDMPLLPNDLNKGDVFEAIRHERRVEFAFEGKTGYDLRRWGIAGEFLRSSERWQNNTAINPQWGGEYFKYVDGKHEILPIPQIEIDKSDNTLIQHDPW